MKIKFQGTPDEAEYLVRMLVEMMARKHERELD